MKFYYAGVDITKDVFINRCEHDTYAGGRADTMRIRFVDSKNLWDAWSPQCGDEIRLTEQAADTGAMFIADTLPENGLFTIFATSLPPGAQARRSRVWEDFRFLQIAEDIAARHGLTVKTYEVTDRTYAYIRQDNLSDFEFFNRLCLLTIKIGADGHFRYSDASACAYGAAEIRSGDFYGKFTAPNGDASRVLRPSEQIACASSAEAIRFAQGVLRAANKGLRRGDFRRKLTCNFAAGSVVNIENEKAPSWNGKVFVTHTRADYVRGISKIFFRRPLEGY